MSKSERMLQRFSKCFWNHENPLSERDFIVDRKSEKRRTFCLKIFQNSLMKPDQIGEIALKLSFFLVQKQNDACWENELAL